MPLPERDRQTLENAHISLEQVGSEVAEFLRREQDTLAISMTDALSEHERAFLQRSGAVGIDSAPLRQIRGNILSVASEYGRMAAQSYTLNEVAELLGVTPGRIRQRLDAGTLYAVTSHRGRVCPRWQFHEGATLPGLESVLKAIGPGAHPIAVERFFLTINPDLESPILDTPLSPRDWLISGHPVDEVVVLAREL